MKATWDIVYKLL